jgi:hypothetical protein
MRCPGCRRELADNEPVFQVSVGYFSPEWAKGRLIEDRYATVGHVCAGCREWIEAQAKSNRVSESCEQCGRPVFNLARRKKPKHIACSQRCRIALYNARARRWRKASMPKRTCACGKVFTPRRADGVYCSAACRQRAYRQRDLPTPRPPPRPARSGTSASISTTSAGVRCGNRAATRLGTARMAARNVRRTPPQTFSTSAASTSSPRNLAAARVSWRLLRGLTIGLSLSPPESAR